MINYSRSLVDLTIEYLGQQEQDLDHQKEIEIYKMILVLFLVLLKVDLWSVYLVTMVVGIELVYI